MVISCSQCKHKKSNQTKSSKIGTRFHFHLRFVGDEKQEINLENEGQCQDCMNRDHYVTVKSL